MALYTIDSTHDSSNTIAAQHDVSPNDTTTTKESLAMRRMKPSILEWGTATKSSSTSIERNFYIQSSEEILMNPLAFEYCYEHDYNDHRNKDSTNNGKVRDRVDEDEKRDDDNFSIERISPHPNLHRMDTFLDTDELSSSSLSNCNHGMVDSGLIAPGRRKHPNDVDHDIGWGFFIDL